MFVRTTLDLLESILAISATSLENVAIVIFLGISLDLYLNSYSTVKNLAQQTSRCLGVSLGTEIEQEVQSRLLKLCCQYLVQQIEPFLLAVVMRRDNLVST